MIQATNLLCNNTANPLGVDSPAPLFAWRAGIQSAYRLIVADSAKALAEDNGNIWDSGKFHEDKSQGIDYDGKKLKSATRYFWKVKLWDGAGSEGQWSETAWFETGLLTASDWQGKWIDAPKPVTPAKFALPAPDFRKSFTLAGGIASARAYICGLGYSELYVNGSKVGDAVVNPPFTTFDKTCLYCTYDITSMLKPGENVIGAVLGNGMYFVDHKNAWDFEKAPWKDNPKLLLQANITLANGSTVNITTGSGWKTATGPITSDSLYVGETYDARLEMPGWCKAGYDDSAWSSAVVCRAPGGVLKSMQMEPIRKVEEFVPKSLKEVHPGVWVYDMGRSIAGWAKLTVKGPAGTVVGLKYTEELLENGDVDDANLKWLVECESFQYDSYTLKGEGVETWEPRFTYHGFQYVRLTGFPGTPDLTTLTGCVVHTELETGGGFTCSNELINKIQAAARAATTNNYHGMPTDCPHREKNGWTGDALISSEQVLMNFKPLNAYKKWLGDIMDCQRPSGQLPGIAPTGGWGYNWGSGPMWDSIIVLLPWNIYLYTGDSQVLKDTWEAIRKYIGFMDSMSEDGTVDFGLGDWCPPEGGADGAKTPTALSDTWFYYVDTLTASKIATIVGKKAEADYYAAHAETIRKAFLKRFVNEQTGEVTGDCQTSYACALQYGIVQGELAAKIFARLVDEVERCNRHIDSGILGAKIVLQVLADGGRADLAYAIAAQKDFPSWGHWIEQGATTLWEMWNGDSSRNHHMFSDVSGFFYKVLAGINPDEAEPGFKHTVLKPCPVPGLDYASGWHESHYGTVRCAWHKDVGGLTLDIEVPEGTTATLRIPKGYKCASINKEQVVSDMDTMNLDAGTYSINAKSI